MIKVTLVSANGLSLGIFKTPEVPRRDEKVIIKGERCTVTGVAYDFDAEDVYAIVFLDVTAVEKSEETTKNESAGEPLKGDKDNTEPAAEG